jgi:hypothetical protein
MALVKVTFESKYHELVAVVLASSVGFLGLVNGMFLVAAPCAEILFISIPVGFEILGLVFVTLGMFAIQDAKRQKGYSEIRSQIEKLKNVYNKARQYAPCGRRTLLQRARCCGR